MLLVEWKVCGLVLPGHIGRIIKTIAISPDSNFIVSGEWNGFLKLWNIHNNEFINQFCGHDDRVTSVSFTQDSNQVVSTSADGMIKFWSLPTWDLLLTIEGHKNIVNSAVITTDRCYAISCSDDKMLKVWDLKNECLLAGFCGFGALIDCAVSLDGEKIVVAETSGGLHILHLEAITRGPTIVTTRANEAGGKTDQGTGKGAYREAIRHSEDPSVDMIRQLLKMKGIGLKSAWLYTMEFLSWRKFRTRKEDGTLAGLMPTPHESGSSSRERGMSMAGNRHICGMAIEIA
jgi:WD40 repeat protein